MRQMYAFWFGSYFIVSILPYKLILHSTVLKMRMTSHVLRPPQRCCPLLIYFWAMRIVYQFASFKACLHFCFHKNFTWCNVCRCLSLCSKNVDLDTVHHRCVHTHFFCVFCACKWLCWRNSNYVMGFNRWQEKKLEEEDEALIKSLFGVSICYQAASNLLHCCL